MQGSQDTIVAIASGPGRGGIGVVRLSGMRAHAIGKKIFRAKHASAKADPPGQKLIFGQVVRANGTQLDEGYLVYFFPPNSYTGEEAVEFFGHGSPVVLAEVVARCQEEGARLSRGGEFTQRAFLNGKMDLVQAEAVAELIEANSAVEAEGARRRMRGMLSEQVEALRRCLIELLAEIEAELDFTEEGLDFLTEPQKNEKTQQIQELIGLLKSSYRTNQRLASGFQVVLAGRPNVGKSSLFNALLHHDRAIVTAVPGTTRDTLREEVVWRGRPVRLIDTAGLREESQDPIEGQGMQRSRSALAEAQMTLLVLDATTGWTQEDRAIFQSLAQNAKVFKVWNKLDLGREPEVGQEGEIEVSAKTGQGMETLRKALEEEVIQALPTESFGGISNDRHWECLNHAQEAVQRARAQLGAKASSEFVAFELQEALSMVTEMLGSKESSEAVLDEIFSRFCIGK